MHLLLKYSLLSCLFFVPAFSNELIFDLKDQYFSTTIGNETKDARYELSKVFVDTNMKFNNNIYRDGYLTVTLKDTINNWTIIQSHKAKVNSYDRAGDTVFRVTSNSGNSFYIAFMDEKIIINGKEFKTGDTKNKQFVTEISKQNDTFVVKLNGSTALTTNVLNFGQLKKIETQSNKSYDSPSSDFITSLEVYSK